MALFYLMFLLFVTEKYLPRYLTNLKFLHMLCSPYLVCLSKQYKNINVKADIYLGKHRLSIS